MEISLKVSVVVLGEKTMIICKVCGKEYEAHGISGLFMCPECDKKDISKRMSNVVDEISRQLAK